MISANYVVGTFDNIQLEQMIPVPNAEKIIFASDGALVMVSINDNQHYMEYRNSDGVATIENDSVNSVSITKIYVKSSNPAWTSRLRIWAVR